MLSAVGTGSILFTPRVASVYEYQLLWLLLLVVFFMWVMIREMARFSIVTRLFSEVWGRAGEYLLLAAIIIALGGSVLANQDGWGRSFADMTLILTRDKRAAGDPGPADNALHWLERRTGLPMFERRYLKNLKRLFVLTVTGLIPIGIILAFKDPVAVMSASGIIAALHTPFIALAALYVNRTRLPKTLRPGLFITLCMAASGLFYLGFAGVYLWDLIA